MTCKNRHISRLAALLLAAPAAILTLPPEPAFAWRIVYDPTNYSQNVLQAARALEQINQQIAQLQNEAQMLINDARNLASLPQSSLQALQQSVQETQALLGEAQRIAYDVQAIDEAFATDYGAASTTATDQALIDGARDRWQTTVGGLQDAMRVQAGVVGNIETGRAEMEDLVGASQNATGALQATQAGNQILALQSQQIMDLTALLAAQGRAASLAAAAETAAQEQAAEQRRRFLEPGTGYRPGNATMFRQ
jgi:P-type conjugative transfer protein TrbJ